MEHSSQVEHILREYREAVEDNNFALAQRIAEANPDLIMQLIAILGRVHKQRRREDEYLWGESQ